jgi:hypothetical protein
VVVAVLGGVVSAAAATTATPRAGKYAGAEANGAAPLPVTFVVTPDRTRITSFNGQSAEKDGCTNHIKSFEAPPGPMAISPTGTFSATSTNHAQKGVRVKVTGHFVSQVKARGRISVRVRKVDGCNISRPFTAHRTGPATS